MFSKQDIKIQAYDVTLLQVEKAKDYNVIVTSEDDVPLANIPLIVAFYNNDYTFERQTTTNEYGVASVPMYLSGNAWFVDVHFKGNEEYKPQVVTREINIEKFERLDSYITSENLVINIDEQSMNGTYYTIYLKDSYDRPIVNEPVYIVVEQTGVDDPQTYVDMVIRTDDNGVVVVPFLSHDENVKITTIYDGCTRFKPCLNADIVAFAEVEPRNTIEFRLCNLSDYTVGEPSADDYRVAVEYKIGDGRWNLLEEDRVFLTPYLSMENRYYKDYNMGWFYFDSMDTGTYRITLCFDGMSEYSSGEFANTYPFCRTFIYNNTTDTRKSLSEWIEYQGGSEEDELTISSRVDGTLSHIKLVLDYELPYEIATLLIYPTSRRFYTLPTYEESDGFYRKTVLEFDVVNPSRDITWGNSLEFTQQNHSYISGYGFDLVKSITIINNSRTATTLTQTGFGEQGQTYQNLNIFASVSNAPMHTKINDYCILTFINYDTMEVFNYYSYLVDNVTPVPLSFNLGVGYWRMTVISKDTNSYKGGYVRAEAQLSTDTPVIPLSNNIIVNSENYINLGTDSPTFNDETLSTATTDDDIHSIMALEFTNSNYYRLSFNAAIEGESTIIYGSDPTLETLDGLFINNSSITLYNDGIETDRLILDTPLFNQESNQVIIQKYGTTVTIFINDTQVYNTDLLSWSTIGLYQTETGSEMTLSYFTLEPYVATDITPSVADYDGTVFGSNIHLEIKDNQLDLIDYGMLPEGSIGGGKVILNDVPLENVNEYAIQLEMRYNNTRFERLNNLTGQMQMRVYEDISTSDSVKDYTKTLCSPMPVPNSKTVFTRHTDEGTLYFVKDPLDANSNFLSNAYNQYKGGVEITSETGVSLFNLDNSYSPVFVGNELVRAEFHRRSGFIRIARYDETSGDWVNVNTLKLRNYPQLVLNEYNDDYAEIAFGNTVWKFYRGRPFIIVNHSQDNLRIMELVDRVYCETVENQRGMGYITDYNPNEITVATDENGVVIGNYSTFNPQLSIQQFRQELHIGENIRLDNFQIYEAGSNNDIGEVATDSAMGILNVDNDNALQIYKDDTKLALNFPSYSHYVEKINDTFTLSISYLDCPFENITIKARGFDERGDVPIKDDIQYGIWEQSVNVTVDTTAPDSIRATFTNCPAEVKYIDFLIFFEGSNSTDIILKDIMYYEGDAVINYDVDTSRVYAEQVEVHFADTYFANLYNEKDSGGLCIARPYQEPFSLRSIYASKETVLIPYMKKCAQWDKPEQVFLEYLNANRQIIDIDWEN